MPDGTDLFQFRSKAFVLNVCKSSDFLINSKGTGYFECGHTLLDSTVCYVMIHLFLHSLSKYSLYFGTLCATTQ